MLLTYRPTHRPDFPAFRLFFGLFSSLLLCQFYPLIIFISPPPQIGSNRHYVFRLSVRPLFVRLTPISRGAIFLHDYLVEGFIKCKYLAQLLIM